MLSGRVIGELLVPLPSPFASAMLSVGSSIDWVKVLQRDGGFKLPPLIKRCLRTRLPLTCVYIPLMREEIIPFDRIVRILKY